MNGWKKFSKVKQDKENCKIFKKNFFTRKSTLFTFFIKNNKQEKKWENEIIKRRRKSEQNQMKKMRLFNIFCSLGWLNNFIHKKIEEKENSLETKHGERMLWSNQMKLKMCGN